MTVKVHLIYKGPAHDAGPDLDHSAAELAGVLGLTVEQARELLAQPESQLGGELDLGHAGQLADRLRAQGLHVELVKVVAEAAPPQEAPMQPEPAGDAAPAAGVPPVVAGNVELPVEQEPQSEAPAGDEPEDNLQPEHFDGPDMAKARVLAEQLQESGHPPPHPAAAQEPPASAEAEPATKTCPFCAETILAAAVKCKHCGEFLGPRPVVPAAETVAGGGEKATPPASKDIVEEVVEVEDTLDLSSESKVLLGTETEDQAPPESESKALADEAPEGWAEPPPERSQAASND